MYTKLKNINIFYKYYKYIVKIINPKYFERIRL